MPRLLQGWPIRYIGTGVNGLGRAHTHPTDQALGVTVMSCRRCKHAARAERSSKIMSPTTSAFGLLRKKTVSGPKPRVKMVKGLGERSFSRTHQYLERPWTDVGPDSETTLEDDSRGSAWAEPAGSAAVRFDSDKAARHHYTRICAQLLHRFDFSSGLH